MSFSDHKITAFQHKITDLPDQPTLAPNELKARFDSSPEELRQAVNGICDDASRLEARVEGIVVDTFGDTIDREMLSNELAAELDAKATQTALAAEQTARQSEDRALNTRVTSAESTISTHTSQISQKSEVYFGTYVGNADEETGIGNQTVNIGFTPKAVLVLRTGADICRDNWTYGGLALTGYPARMNGETVLQIVTNGFRAYSDSPLRIRANDDSDRYYYFAFK